tara:strand:+ start:4015 stop:5649 length:1635 start_codon:yes stop_codon:yes gene_type:complete
MKKDRKLEFVEKENNPFEDLRGKISNYKLSEKINLVATITSKSNTLRSNHYHPIQQQKCLLIEGQYVSIYKDLKKPNAPKITHLINKGDLVITEPMVAHTMVFRKDSIFLNLVNGEREHKNYGKTHTIPFELINKKEKEFLFKNYKDKCRVCGKSEFLRCISLGYQPFANNFASSPKDQEKYPLEVNVCKNCRNGQLSILPNFKKIFSKYLYKSSISAIFKKHFENAAKKYVKFFNIKKNDFIIDIGSNDGIGLIPFKKMGFKNILGIEPANNLVKETRKIGIKTINKFFNEKIISDIKSKAKLIMASNVFAHADNLHEAIKTMKQILKPNGKIIIEVQYFPKMLKNCTFDNIYHEHVNYWSLYALNKFCNLNDLKIFKVEEIDTHGGSIRVYITKEKKFKIENSVSKILNNEKSIGILDDKIFLNYGKKIRDLNNNLKANLNKLNKKYKLVAGYGAPAKASTVINFAGINKQHIKFIIDDNKLKKNKFIPGTKIKIVSKNNIKKVDCIVVFAWNFYSDIKKNNSDIGKKFISIRDLYKKDLKI